MKKFEKILRSVYVYFIYTLTFFISGFFINCLQCVLYLTLKPYNKNLYRKINYYLCYTVYSQMMFLAEWYAGAEIVFYMDKTDYDKYFGKEHAFVIVNHKYEIDWLLIGMLSEKAHCCGNFKAYMKKVLQYAPAIGWCFYFSDNVFLERSFEKDKKIIHQQISEIVNYSDPIWLILYPEGTRFTPDKYKASLKIAKEKGLPELRNLLTPRTKGFVTSLTPMKDKMSALYDVTITFNTSETMQPTTRNMFMGGKMQAHIYLKRIPFGEVPQDEIKAATFLHNIFVQKDKLQDSFLKTGDYFEESGIKRLEPIKFSRSFLTGATGIFWHSVIIVPLIYYLVKMLFTASLYNICLVYGLIFLFSFALSKTFSLSQTKKGSSYGTSSQNSK